MEKASTVKVLVGAFNQEKALVGAFSVIVKTDGSFAALVVNMASDDTAPAQGDPSHDHLVLGLGVSIFLASLALVWWGEKHAVIIFSNMAGAELRIDSSVNT